MNAKRSFERRLTKRIKSRLPPSSQLDGEHRPVDNPLSNHIFDWCSHSVRFHCIEFRPSETQQPVVSSVSQECRAQLPRTFYRLMWDSHSCDLHDIVIDITRRSRAVAIRNLPCALFLLSRVGPPRVVYMMSFEIFRYISELARPDP